MSVMATLRRHRRGRLLRLALLAAAVCSPLVLASTVPTDAAAPRSVGQIDSATSSVHWKGGPFSLPGGAPGAGNPLPQVCAVTCERWTLDIVLPASAWSRPRDGVLIAIHHASSSDGLNLYVYGPTGQQVGSANGIDSDGQAVLLTHPANGQYTITVTATELADSNVTYSGEARLRPDPCSAGNCLLLPSLEPAPPSEFTITGLPVAPSTALGFPFPFQFGPATPQSCWVDETATQGAHRCLRLTNEIDNVGTGPLILRFRLLDPLLHPGVDLHNEYLTGCQMQQVIERDDGTTLTRDAGPCVYHLTHGHFHYQNMANFALHAVNADGSTGKELRSSKKQGFCLTDVRAAAFGTTALDARHYWFPNCNLPSQLDSNAWVRMGVDPGWGDVYTWDVPAQYIEITGVPDGIYDVVSVSNPLGQILEAGGHQSGVARTRICLKGNTATAVALSATRCEAATRGQMVAA